MQIAIVDHSFHQKTGSSRFFCEILEQLGGVTHFWDDSWRSGDVVTPDVLNASRFDLVVFWQVLWSVSALRQLECRRILLIPMYDDVGDRGSRKWFPYRQYFFVSFSITLHRQLLASGVRSFHLQYYPSVENDSDSCGKDYRRAFFWERNQDVNVETVLRWFQNFPEFRVHHHAVLDPGHDVSDRVPSPSGWEVSTWFANKADYLLISQSCGIYIAPRAREGIGMSFLEAMAVGQVVVGLPQPTLNEYVISGQNGILVPSQESISPDTDWEQLGRAAQQSVVLGRGRYLQSVLRLVELLRGPTWTAPIYISWPKICLWSVENLWERALEYLRAAKHKLVARPSMD